MDSRRIADITGDLAKSKQFLPFLQRAGRMQVRSIDIYEINGMDINKLDGSCVLTLGGF
jgi:hypothetical protein